MKIQRALVILFVFGFVLPTIAQSEDLLDPSQTNEATTQNEACPDINDSLVITQWCVDIVEGISEAVEDCASEVYAFCIDALVPTYTVEPFKVLYIKSKEASLPPLEYED